MSTFHVVIWHKELREFSSMRYTSGNPELTEKDMLEIEYIYADTSRGVTLITTEIISWQKLAEMPKGR